MTQKLIFYDEPGEVSGEAWQRMEANVIKKQRIDKKNAWIYHLWLWLWWPKERDLYAPAQECHFCKSYNFLDSQNESGFPVIYNGVCTNRASEYYQSNVSIFFGCPNFA